MNPPVDTKKADVKPIRVLLLDDHADNLLLRAAILRQHGYDAISSSSVEDAESKINDIDIAVLDYHLGAGQFGPGQLYAGPTHSRRLRTGSRRTRLFPANHRHLRSRRHALTEITNLFDVRRLSEIQDNPSVLCSTVYVK